MGAAGSKRYHPARPEGTPGVYTYMSERVNSPIVVASPTHDPFFYSNLTLSQPLPYNKPGIIGQDQREACVSNVQDGPGVRLSQTPTHTEHHPREDIEQDQTALKEAIEQDQTALKEAIEQDQTALKEVAMFTHGDTTETIDSANATVTLQGDMYFSDDKSEDPYQSITSSCLYDKLDRRMCTVDEVTDSCPYDGTDSEEEPYHTISSIDVGKGDETMKKQVVNWIKEHESRHGILTPVETEERRCSKLYDQMWPDKTDHIASCSFKRRKSVSKEDFFEFMCQVYRSVLARRLQAGEIVPYLDFVDISDIEGAGGPKNEVYQLLTHIHRSSAPGKWTSFLQALIRTDNEHPRDLITGKTEKDNCQNAMVLKLYQPEIAKDISLDDMLDCLTEEEVITEVDKERVKARQKERGETHAAMLLLDLVPNRKEDWNEKLIKSLRRCGLGDFANYLEEVSKNKADEETVVKKAAVTRLNRYTPMPGCGLKGDVVGVETGQVDNHTSANKSLCKSPGRLSSSRLAVFEKFKGTGNKESSRSERAHTNVIQHSPPIPARCYTDWKDETTLGAVKTSHDDDDVQPESVPPLPPRKPYTNSEMKTALEGSSNKIPTDASETGSNWDIVPQVPPRTVFKPASEKAEITCNDDEPRKNYIDMEYDDTVVRRLSGCTSPANATASVAVEGDHVTVKDRLQRIDFYINQIEHEKRQIHASRGLNVDNEDNYYTKLMHASASQTMDAAADDNHNTQITLDDANVTITDPEMLETIQQEREASIKRGLECGEDMCDIAAVNVPRCDESQNTTETMNNSRIEIEEECNEIPEPHSCDIQQLARDQTSTCELYKQQLVTMEIGIGKLYEKIEHLLEKTKVESCNQATQTRVDYDVSAETEINNQTNENNVLIQELISKVSQLESKLENVSSKDNYVKVQRVPMEEQQFVQGMPGIQPVFMPPQSPPWYQMPVPQQQFVYQQDFPAQFIPPTMGLHHPYYM